MKRLLLLVSWLVVCFRLTAQHADNKTNPKRGFILTAPSRLMANKLEKMCLVLHNLQTYDGIVFLELLSDNSTTLASTNSPIFEGKNQCLELFVPESYIGTATLTVRGMFRRSSDEAGYNFQQSKPVTIGPDRSTLVFIQTDKPIYKPGDKVRFRILRVTTKMKPMSDQIPSIWIEDPSDVRISQWLMETPDNGLIDLELKLTSEPILGKWLIKVDTGSAIDTQTFEVREYVLPKFEVKITQPSYILANQLNATWKVCAHYSYGKPVEGTTVIKVVLGNIAAPVKTSALYEGEIKGCQEVVGEVRSILRRFGPFHMEIQAAVIENGTNEKMTAFEEIELQRSELLLDLKSFKQPHLKPGLPFYGKLRVTTPDHHPVPNVNVLIGFEKHNFVEPTGDGLTGVFTSDKNGFVTFASQLVFDKPQFISIKARVVSSTSAEEDAQEQGIMQQPSATAFVQSWLSPSQNFIQIKRPTFPVPCDGKQTFTVFHTEAMKDVLINYQVVDARANIAFSSSMVHTSKDDDGQKESRWSFVEEDEEFERLKSFTLTVPISCAMLPFSRLLVFYIRDDGEVVSDTLEFPLEKRLPNEVKITFEPQQVMPATAANLYVDAHPYSLCALSIVDKAVHFLRESNMLTLNKVMDSLSQLNVPKDKVPSYCRNQCRETTGPLCFWLPWRLPSFADAAAAFQEAAVTVYSDLKLEVMPCPDPPVVWNYYLQPMRHVDAGFLKRKGKQLQLAPDRNVVVEQKLKKAVVEIRTHFPETWLWNLRRIGSSGKAILPLEVPHSITEWVAGAICLSKTAGLGVATPAHLKAFQPFFITYTLPYSVKRGETFPLIVSTHNHIKECSPVKLTLQKSEDFSIVSEFTFEKFCLCSDETKTVTFRLRPKVLGRMNITVYAYMSSPEICKTRSTKSISKDQARDAMTKFILVEAEGFPKEQVINSLLCPREGEENVIKGKIELNLPQVPIVPGTTRAFLTIFGDMMGSTLQGLHHLVRQPTGCGEQNMVLFTPNIFVLQYLKSTDQWTAALEKEIISHLKIGYQREMIYRHADGSYSAFGSKDPEGSIWLTAFVVKSFAQASPFIYVDKNVLNESITWITGHQLENGCYPFIGTVLHKGMKGGVTESEGSFAALTAFITIALLEAGFPPTHEAIRNAFYCLNAEKLPDVYTLILSTYAAFLAGEADYAEQLVNRTIGHATSKDNLLYWEKSPNGLTALSVEMSAYALLALLKMEGEKIKARQIVRWLTQQKNSNGGFVSTQDTVIALQALAEYAKRFQSKDVDMDILVEAEKLQHVFYVNQENRLLQQLTPVPEVPAVIDITAVGKGCALLQAVVRYNVEQITGVDAFSLDIKSEKVGTTSASCKRHQLFICTRYKLEDEYSNMVVIEIKMLSGFVPDKNSLTELSNNSEVKLKRWEVENDQLNMYFDKLVSVEKCFSFKVIQMFEVDDIKPSSLKVYDYYQPELFVAKNYSLKGCKSEPLPQPSELTEEELTELESLIIADLDSSANVGLNSNDFSSVLSTESPKNKVSDKANPDGIEAPVVEIIPDPIYVQPLGSCCSNEMETSAEAKSLKNFKSVDTDRDFPEGVEGPPQVYVPPPTQFWDEKRGND